jgi:hypothetical protein
MPVTITTTPGAAYVWSGAGFAWDAAEAGKTWADAAAASVLVEESDGLGLGAMEARLPATALAEGFGLGDGRDASVTDNWTEPLVIGETYIDLIGFVLSIAEAIGVGSGPSLGVTIPRASSFAIGEARTSEVRADSQRVLAIAEAYADVANFLAQVGEQLALSEVAPKDLINAEAELFALRNRILRASQAVIADLAFRTAPIDAEGFASLVSQSRALGFGAFRDLSPGDYEYASALVRLVLEAPSITGTRTVLTNARLNIDVPDRRDRGTVAVPPGGALVSFAEPFTVAPEIQATFKGGGTVAIPQIGQITTSGFFLTLVNPTTQATVAGNASWSAEGY